MEHITHTKAAVMTVIGFAGGLLSRVYGGWSSDMTTLLLFMAIDYAMGLIVAGVFRRSDKAEGGGLDSTAGREGLWRKGVTLLVVLVAARLDVTLGVSFIRNAAVIAFIANEVISMMENTALMGVPWPEPMVSALAKLQGKTQAIGAMSNLDKEDKQDV